LYGIVKLFFVSFGHITLYKENLPDFPLFSFSGLFCDIGAGQVAGKGL